MKNYTKYRPGYYMPPETCMDWVKKERITQAPDWCSVDLRDGNQALITPIMVACSSWRAWNRCGYQLQIVSNAELSGDGGNSRAKYIDEQTATL